jgi:hypothetical protein
MSRRNISIDRLEIRLNGVPQESARAAVGDLGRELMGQLATPRAGPRPQRTGRIERLDSGTVQLASGSTPSELRKTIAGRLAVSIHSNAKSRS